jgi:hypothetical protein
VKRLLLRAVSFDVFACQHIADFYRESPGGNTASHRVSYLQPQLSSKNQIAQSSKVR